MKVWSSKLIAAIVAVGLGAGVAYAQASNTVALGYQSVPALLEQATLVGHHAPRSVIKLTFGLKLNNADGLDAFLRNVRNPSSPAYHHWLTPAEAAARFGPTPAQVTAVTQWLKARGIEVRDVTPNRILIHTRATTEAYERALGITINDYALDKRTFFSTMDQPKLPASIAGYMQNVIGLNNAAVMRPMRRVKPLRMANRPAKVSPRIPAPPPQTSTYFRPVQIAAVYDIPDITNPANGAGVTTAILTADSSGLASLSDYHDFWAAFDLPDHTVNVVNVDGDNGYTDGLLETMLDMEWNGALAPGTAQVVYVAANPGYPTFTDMYSQFQTDNLAQVMTTDWGEPEVDNPDEATDENIFALAATQGISMFAATGNEGSSGGTGGTNACIYPSASSYVTAAGGTLLHTDRDGNWLSEVAMSFSGGAVCSLPQPDWQTGPGVPANGVRDTADVSMNSDGYLVVQGGGWWLVGGTGAASSGWAAIFADAVAVNGASIGQANELIYNDVNAGNYASDFRDITSGNNGLYSAGPDWDHPSGWGSPLATSLIQNLLIQGPKGTAAGTVTDAASGNPIAGALISFAPSRFSTYTNAQGNYSETLPTGDYTATASAFGYEPQSAAITIGDGQTTTQDFALQTSPTATLGGKVTDSGHGYPLFAEVVATSGTATVADVWTNPQNGFYGVSLPVGTHYTVTVTPYFSGYTPGTVSGTLTDSTRKNFSLQPDASCSAPGYAYQQSCSPIPGGLVQGQVTDRNTGDVLVGATLTDESGNRTTTMTRGDRTGYVMFEPAGDHTLTASRSNRQDSTRSVSVSDGSLNNVNFGLNAGRLEVRPARAALDVPVGTQQTYRLRIGDSGRVPVDFTVTSLNAPPPAVRQHERHDNVPLHLVRGHYSPASLLALGKQGRAADAVHASSAALAPHQGTAPWTAIADYPVPVLDSCAATDPVSGLVYSVGGMSNAATTSSAYVYDPSTNGWSSIASLPEGLDKPACAMVDGKLYVTAGWDAAGFNSQALYVYDPASDGWSTGANLPISLGGGSSGVALNGEFYVIAGCSGIVTCGGSNGVEVYDPSTNGWSAAADYPEYVAWQGCGATEGKIYCAGGAAGRGDTADAYAYDPAADGWSSIAPIPYDNWGMSVIATSDGHLLLQDGVTNGQSTQTNQGAIYDLASDTWSMLPNNIVTTYRAAGACGFYMIGGMDFGGTFSGIANAEVLPGYDECGAGTVPWLSFNPSSGTVTPGTIRAVTVMIDGTGQTPGTSDAVQMWVNGDTPYGAIAIPLTVNWTSGE